MRVLLLLGLLLGLAACTVNLPDCSDRDGGIGGTGQCQEEWAE